MKRIPLHDPELLPLPIDQLFAFIVSDDKGGEGLAGCAIEGVFMPLIGADMDRIESIKPLAQQIANQTHKQVRLCRFYQREELELIIPQ